MIPRAETSFWAMQVLLDAGYKALDNTTPQDRHNHIYDNPRKRLADLESKAKESQDLNK